MIMLMKSTKMFEYQYENEDEHESLDKLISTIVDRISDRITGDTNIKKNEIVVGEAIINVLEKLGRFVFRRYSGRKIR